ncbi:MAG: hypothetical protein HQM16_10515 [Deltaproteobacteria bacterium]|nr:hypothetical protein [Deltaproteobacteria bacterium]
MMSLRTAMMDGARGLINRVAGPETAIGRGVAEIDEALLQTPLAPAVDALKARFRTTFGGVTPRGFDRGLWRQPVARTVIPASAPVATPGGVKSVFPVNGIENPDNNPVLDFTGMPRFDSIRAEHVVPAMQRVDAKVRQKLAALEERLAQMDHPTWEQVVLPLNDIERLIYLAWQPIDHLKATMSSDALEKACEEAKKIYIDMGLAMGQSKAVHAALQKIRAGVEWFRLDEGQRRAIDSRIKGAESSGIALKGQDLARFNWISKRLGELTSLYTDNVTKATMAFELVVTDANELRGLNTQDLEALAEAYKGRHPDGHATQASPGPWLVTIDPSCYTSIMSRCENSALKEVIFRARAVRASAGEYDNTGHVDEIISLRQESARLLGYQTHADHSLSRKMAGQVASADHLLKLLHDASKTTALQEKQELQAFAVERGYQGELKPWDTTYYLELMMKERFDVNDEVLKQYFDLSRVMDGVFEVVQNLFGVKIRPADGKAPVYHTDVRYFEVVSKRGDIIASFYFDPYERAGQKRGGAWMNDVRKRRQLPDGTFTVPTATLTTNFEACQRQTIETHNE